MENEKPKGGGMEKLASFIVDKRNLFFLLYIFALIFSVIATGWVKVEDDITTYLPDTTETRQGLTVMNDNFVTYGTANVMVSNITYDTALDIQSRLEDIEGVTTVEFDDTDEHYTNASALFSVSFDAEVGDERAENALQEIRDELEGSYDTSIYSEVGYDSSADLQSEMVVIVIIAAIIRRRADADLPLLCRGPGPPHDLRRGGAAEHGHKLPVRHDQLHLQLSHRHTAAGAGHRLRHHSVPPFQR